MRFSFLRASQWIGATLVLLVLVGLNYDFDSKAGMRMNASLDDPLSQGLRGYWKLDEGTGTSTTADASGNANTLSMTGPPTWTTGTIGPYAMDFSGSGQYLSVASPASGVLDFAAGASFSITGWFNRDTFTTDHTIVAKRNGQTATDDGYIVYIDDATDTLVFEASDTADTDEYQRVSSSTFTATGWHQFAVTWNDSATTDPVNIFIDGATNNGTATGTFANMGSLVESVAFRIGAESDAGVPFDGKLDDIRVYGSALNADEVAKLYQTTAPTQPVDTGLVGHWTFDGPDVDPINGLVIDQSGRGNDATFNVLHISPTIGKLGQALRSDGTDWERPSIGSPNSNLEMGTSDWSIALWVRLDVGDGGGTDYIIGKGGVSAEGYAIFHDVGAFDTLLANVRTQAGAETYYEAPQAINLIGSSWHHVAVAFDRDDGVWFYVDGASLGKSGSSVYNGTDITNSGAIFAFGGNHNASLSIQGGYDDVRVYSRVLSAGEVANLYNLGR